MENIGALLIGIASSLIATAVFISASEITRRVLLPWYANKIYRGVRLDGNWSACRYGKVEVDSDEFPNASFMLKQSSDKVTGSAILGESKDEKGTLYKLSGQIRDGYFTATAWPTAPDMIDAMAVVFRAYHHGEHLRLKGRMAFVSNETATIKATEKEIEFRKQAS